MMMSLPISTPFDSAANVRELVITDGTLVIDGLGSISGALAISSETTTDGPVETTRLQIGLSGLAGSLTPGGIGASLTGGNGALYVERITTSGTVTSTGYALDVGGSVALDGVSGVTLAADNLNLRYNRLDRAVENMVIATGGDDYVLNLLDNETRLSGAINADIAGMIGLSGQMFIESRTGANARTVTLSDGSTVEVEQLILGGAGLSANVGPAGIGAELTDADAVVIFSTELGGAGRRWVSSVSSIEEASISGYDLADFDDARLAVNSEIVGGALLLDGTTPVIDWDATGEAVTLLPGQSLALSGDERELSVELDGALNLGPASLRGDFSVSLDASDAGEQAWHVVARDVSIALEVNGVRAGLDNGQGDLWIGKNDVTGVYGAAERSGSILGSASLTGVEDLTLEGDFATKFDSSGNLTLAGAVDIDVAGFTTISGEFAVEKPALETASVELEDAALSDGASGAMVETQQGGVKQSSRFTLDVATVKDGGN